MYPHASQRRSAPRRAGGNVAPCVDMLSMRSGAGVSCDALRPWEALRPRMTLEDMHPHASQRRNAPRRAGGDVAPGGLTGIGVSCSALRPLDAPRARRTSIHIHSHLTQRPRTLQLAAQSGALGGSLPMDWRLRRAEATEIPCARRTLEHTYIPTYRRAPVRCTRAGRHSRPPPHPASRAATHRHAARRSHGKRHVAAQDSVTYTRAPTAAHLYAARAQGATAGLLRIRRREQRRTCRRSNTTPACGVN